MNACAATTEVSTTGQVEVSRSEVGSIALMPGGGVLADAVAVELANMGFTVIEAEATSALMARLNLDEFDISQPAGLAQLRSNGVDTVLKVRGSGGYDDKPSSATARLVSTTDNRLLSGANWQNAASGRMGSAADSEARVGLVVAAREIATALTSNLR